MAAVERGARLTSQLLAFSRRQMLRPETVLASVLVEDFAGLLRRAVGETISIRIAGEPGLWPCRVDPVQFESALLNLTLNARDAMPAGGNLTISTRNVILAGEEARAAELAPGDYVRVDVADTGSGMDEATLSRALEPFFTTKETGQGSGLGLPQVYGFTRQSGGAVLLDSAPGQGTTVSLLFPRVAAEPVPAVAAPQPQAPPAAPATGSPRTILVVEDEPDVLEVVAATLDSAGHRVLTATAGEQGLDLLRQASGVDLLLTDVVLPGGMTGVELAHAAKRMLPELRVLLTSGYVTPRPGGLDGLELLPKPYRAPELLERVARLLSREPARQESGA
jgi:CheY-like chemotaxis protein